MKEHSDYDENRPTSVGGLVLNTADKDYRSFVSFHHKGGKTVNFVSDKYSGVFSGYNSIVRTTL